MEKFCPRHGPYDAALPECPYCAREAGRIPAQAGGEAPERGYPAAPPTEGVGGPFAAAAEPEDHTLLDAPPPHAPPDLQGIFWVKRGPARGQIFRLQHGTIVGRSQGTVLLRDLKVSNPHAKVVIEDGRFVLWDFASSNGTFVNGERIRQARPLQENDEIRMGDTVMVLKILT